MRSSLNDLPSGSAIYIDSNIFIYEVTNHPKYTAASSSFLDRVESGEVVGVASVLGITEEVHKLSIIELSSKLKKKPQSIVSLIKNDPTLLDKLETPFIAAQNILSMNLEIINLIIPRLIDALELMKSYRLLSHDAIHVAAMKARGISNIATNDPDFERVAWLTVWKP